MKLKLKEKFMVESILKEQSFKINLSQSIELKHIINIDNILFHNFEKSPLKINGFSIEKKERYYFLKKGRFFRENKLFEVYDKVKNYENILLKYRELFLKLKNDNAIVTSDINHLINYLYYDLIIYLEIAAYKHRFDIDYEDEKQNISKILGKKLEYSGKKNKSQQIDYKKSTLVQRATNTKYWHRSFHSKKLDYAIVKLAEKINPIELELPLRYESDKVISLLQNFNYLLDLMKITNREFELRFKKLGHYKKEGLYLKNAKTLVIDPRYSTTLFHEFGHFLHETNTPFYLKNKKITKRERNKIIKEHKFSFKNRLNNHKSEELDEESEIFAYWFEELVKNDILNRIKSEEKK